MPIEKVNWSSFEKAREKRWSVKGGKKGTFFDSFFQKQGLQCFIKKEELGAKIEAVFRIR